MVGFLSLVWPYLRQRTWLLWLTVFVTSLPVSYYTGKHKGAALAHAEASAKAAALVSQYDKRYREQEAKHAKTVEDLRVNYIVKATKEEVKDARIASDYRSGVVRLRFRTTSCPKPAETIPSAARVDAAEVATIAPETSESLYSIAADGDTAIRQLTALQEWVQSALTLCDGR